MSRAASGPRASEEHGEGFVPPPYPYERLARIAELAASHEGGVVDLSIGTPCDPPPESALRALAGSGTERGYPRSVGSDALRSEAAHWLARRFGAEVSPVQVAACVGTKEFVAGVPAYLRLRDPSRDTVVAPAVAYPTYAMGARLAGCRLVTVPETESGGVDLSVLSPRVASRTVMAWLNSPSNPTGSLSDLAAAAEWARRHDVPVFSDECYCEFTWEPASPRSILQAGTEKVVAVHSLSKRSNMAGLRVGFYAGDSELVGYLSSVRQHAGLMVPGPVQAAACAALADDEHVELQRRRYRRRLENLGAILEHAGLEAPMPEGGFYLWVAVPDWALEAAPSAGSPAAWVLTEALARAGGVLVSPGDLYGEAGAGYVRVAVVAPDERIELVGTRLAACRLADAAPMAGRVGERLL